MLQRWTYAADALEELCPGASSASSVSKLSRFWQTPPPSLAAVVAPSSSSDGNDGSCGKTAEIQRQLSNNRFPLTVAAAAAAAAAADTAAAAVEAAKNHAGLQHQPALISTAGGDKRQLTMVGAAGATGDTRVGCDNACSSSSCVPPNSGLPRPQPTLDSTITMTTAAAAAAGVVSTESAISEDGEPAGTHSSLFRPPPPPPPPPLASGAVPLTTPLPVAEAVALSSAASATTSPTIPQSRQQLVQQPALSLPAAVCSQENLVSVARELQEYAEAVARARPPRAAKCSGKDGVGDVAGGALGAGIEGGSGSVSPSMYLQGPPPECLFDALLDEVVQALGDA